MDNYFDVIVVGSGPAGEGAAVKAAKMGKSVAIVERGLLGGTCLNRGCIPTKTLVHSAELFRQARESEALGLRFADCRYDYEIMGKRKEEVVGKLRSGLETTFSNNKVQVIKGSAFIEKAGEVRVGGDVYRCGNILVATGGKPATPPIPGIGLPGVVTSDGLLVMNRPVNELVVIGGGVIGAEFASVFRGFGCGVTIIEAADRLLPSMDADLSQNLAVILKKRGVKVHTSARVSEIMEERDGTLTCRFTASSGTFTASADTVLVAIGRTPATEGLFDTKIAAELGLDRGYIPVDKNRQTKIPGIYAAGDAAKGGYQLAHTAAAEGVNAVCVMFGEEQPNELSVVPACVYTSPEIACVGMTEAEAKETGLEVVTVKRMMHGNAKSIIEQADRGFIKLVAEAGGGRLLGAQLMCHRATDMVSELTTAIIRRLTVTELSQTIRPHPTFSEVISEALGMFN